MIFDSRDCEIILSPKPNLQRISVNCEYPRQCVCTKPVEIGHKVKLHLSSDIKRDSFLFLGYSDSLLFDDNMNRILNRNDFGLRQHCNGLDLIHYKVIVCFV